MLELKDGKKILTTPVSEEDLKDIHIGDIVYLNGSMTTCRDVAHRRLVEEDVNRRLMYVTPQSSMQARSSARLKMISLRWFL
ncbi:MAG: fumarate hydratase C-terminal domain-containing protein [Clostridium sp.]